MIFPLTAHMAVEKEQKIKNVALSLVPPELVSCCDEGGGIWGHLFHGIPLHIVIETNTGCSNALAVDRYCPSILFDNVSTRTQAHREGVRSSDTPMNPCFYETSTPPPPYRGMTYRFKLWSRHKHFLPAASTIYGETSTRF